MSKRDDFGKTMEPYENSLQSLVQKLETALEEAKRIQELDGAAKKVVERSSSSELARMLLVQTAQLRTEFFRSNTCKELDVFGAKMTEFREVSEQILQSVRQEDRRYESDGSSTAASQAGSRSRSDSRSRKRKRNAWRRIGVASTSTDNTPEKMSSRSSRSFSLSSITSLDPLDYPIGINQSTDVTSSAGASALNTEEENSDSDPPLKGARVGLTASKSQWDKQIKAKEMFTAEVIFQRRVDDFPKTEQKEVEEDPTDVAMSDENDETIVPKDSRSCDAEEQKTDVMEPTSKPSENLPFGSGKFVPQKEEGLGMADESTNVRTKPDAVKEAMEAAGIEPSDEEILAEFFPAPTVIPHETVTEKEQLENIPRSDANVPEGSDTGVRTSPMPFTSQESQSSNEAEVQRGSSGEAEPMSTTPEHTSTATEERSQEKCPNLSLLEQIATGINTEQLAPEYRTALEQLRGGLRGPNIQLFSLLLMDMFNQTHLIDTGPPIPKIPVHERQKPSTECTICNAKMPSDVQLHEHMTRRHIVKLLGTKRGALIGSAEKILQCLSSNICIWCEEHFNDNYIAEMHQVYCTGRLRFRCPECGHTSKNLKDLLLKHTHCKYGASKYGCTDCLCPFFGEHEREMHKKWCTKNEKKPWQCTNTGCTQRYSSRCRLREHVYKKKCDGVENFEKDYPIQRHSKETQDDTSLPDVVTIDPAQQQEYINRLKKIAPKSNFIVSKHNAVFINVTPAHYYNEGLKMFVCSGCHTQYHGFGSLTSHMKHCSGGPEPYKCSICGRCFKQRKQLKDHKKNHKLADKKETSTPQKPTQEKDQPASVPHASEESTSGQKEQGSAPQKLPQKNVEPKSDSPKSKETKLTGRIEGTQSPLKTCDSSSDTQPTRNVDIPSDDNSLIEWIWNEANRADEYIVLSSDRQWLTRKDFECLKPEGLLSDRVLNSYLHILENYGNSGSKGRNAVCVLDTFLYPLLLRDGVDKARHHLLKTRVLQARQIIIPIHDVNHWFLVVVNIEKKEAYWLDSMGRDNTRIIRSILQLLEAYLRHKMEKTYDLASWIKADNENGPQQPNHYDCGVFMVTNARYVIDNRPLTYKPSSMDLYRKRMLLSIIRKRLM